MAGRGDYLMVAALDFGTTYSGYAFSMQDSPETITSNSNWGASLGFKSHKTPTSVLTDDKGNFLDMGFEAEQRYTDCLDVNIDSVVTSLDGKITPALEIFGYAIKFLREHLLTEIAKSTGCTPELSDIFWVLTVPAIWSEPSKKFMREAAKRGGCIENTSDPNLLLALEPEAASLCCRRLKIREYGETANISFPEGTKYIVLDCGGGTVDVTAHKILKNEQVEEILPASGGPWGGMYVDKEFEELLIRILGADFINKFKVNHPDAWNELLTSFETVKKSIKNTENSKLRIKLPYVFAKAENESYLIQQVNEYANQNVIFSNGVLIIEHSEAKTFFDKVRREIVSHVRSLLSSSKLTGAKFISMVGGFSECHLLQDAIKEQFGKNGIKVLIPHDCQLAVIKGAVLFGHYPLGITSRISRVTIGTSLKQLFNHEIHDETKKHTNEDGVELCRSVFDVIVTSGESVAVGEERKQETVPGTKTQTSTESKFFLIKGLPKEPVQYTDDPVVEYMGKVIVHHPPCNNTDDNAIKKIYTFGGTEIHVRAIHLSTGKEFTTTLDFLSHAE